MAKPAPAKVAKLSVAEVHGEGKEDFLGLSTAELISRFGQGGAARQSAALEIGRRKYNRIVSK